MKERERESTSETTGAITVLFGIWLFPGTLCVFMGTCKLVCMVCCVSLAMCPPSLQITNRKWFLFFKAMASR